MKNRIADTGQPRNTELIAARIAQDLLTLGAVTLRPNQPFTWASGLEAPIYCDNRLTMTDVAVRKRITEGFLSLLDEHQLAPDVICGTATAGIPHAAWLSQELELPLVYVRSKPKGHGRENLIEGRFAKGATIVVIEDTISTGGSSLKAVEALQNADARVLAVLAIYSYGFVSSREAFQDASVPLESLTDYDALVKAAADMKRLSDDDVRTLHAWREDPQRWSDSRSG